LRLFSFGGYGLALAALALLVFGAIECPLLFSATFTASYPTAINRTGERGYTRQAYLQFLEERDTQSGVQ